MVRESSNNKVSFSYSLKVSKVHLDQLNHVNNTVYLQWVQEASEKHWNVLADGNIKQTNVWMALRHEIDYHGQAFIDDTVKVVTWIDDSFGAKSTRIVHFYKEEELLAKCKTTWVLLDATTLRPKRIGENILKLFSGNQEG